MRSVCMAELTDSERGFAAGDFNGEPPRLASFSFDDVNDFVHSDGITYELLEGAVLDIAAAWQRSRDAQTKLLNREADALAFVAE